MSAREGNTVSKIIIPKGNWHMGLIDAIERALPKQVIVCNSNAMKELALRAIERMGFAYKEIILEVEGTNDGISE